LSLAFCKLGGYLMLDYKHILPKESLRRQAWKVYFVAIALPLYLFFLPYLFARSVLLSFAVMLSVGVYLSTWMACMVHESWHKYVSGISNDFFYNLFSYMLMLDPHIYRLVHGYHHSKVNTWEDVEFHPVGEIRNVYLRRIYNFLEIVIGVIFTFGIQMYVVPRHPRYKARCRASTHWLSIAVWGLFYGSVGLLSAAAFGLSAWQVAVPLLMNFWLGSFFIHQIQLVEHGGLIVEGDFYQRMIQTRNLKHGTFGGKLFLFMTHGVSREHILHHSMVEVYSRPFPEKLPMPENAVYTSLTDYGAILRRMVTKG